jgi:hypothetical protein
MQVGGKNSKDSIEPSLHSFQPLDQGSLFCSTS